MKVVAVSQRVDFYPDRNEQRDALDQRLIDFLLTAGCLPIPVPNSLFAESLGGETFVQWIGCISPAAVVLSGGNDVGSCKPRDLTEEGLLDYAEKEGLPVLGICRGMQMMGVRAGSKLHAVEGHVRTRHALTGEIAREVNSYHNHTLATCPAGFEVLARSGGDNEIEAIRHNSLQWEGWMWHPEREPAFHPDDIGRIRKLFGAC